ncbi:MAG: VOC family protein [Planctomycetota bacterium]
MRLDDLIRGILVARGLSRRDLLRVGGVGGALLALNQFGLGADEAKPAKGKSRMSIQSAVDHLLLGVADLDAGIAWVEKKTGVRAIVGGSHPGVGTRNALLALGKNQYLEIVAPDPAQKDYNFHIDVRKLTEPRLITWAALSREIQKLAEQARAAGFQLFGPSDGSRVRPDGKQLRWKTLGVISKVETQSPSEVLPIPFFIEWATDSPHPAQDAPKGCELVQFEIEHPKPDSVRDSLRTLGLESTPTTGKATRLIATMTTPKGKVTLS